MNVLVVNAGSSAKYQLLDTDTREVFAKGNCERIGRTWASLATPRTVAPSRPRRFPSPIIVLLSLACSRS